MKAKTAKLFNHISEQSTNTRNTVSWKLQTVENLIPNIIMSKLIYFRNIHLFKIHRIAFFLFTQFYFYFG